VPVAFVIGKRLFGDILPRPDSDFYRQKLIAGLETAATTSDASATICVSPTLLAASA
jgi:hypothetical protein